MTRLPVTHPDVHKAFTDGLFSVQRSCKKFSLMALDQSQEHSVKYLKDGGGTKGLYGQPEEKEVIELSKPEVLRVLEEFETNVLESPEKDTTAHPDSATATQGKFMRELTSMVNVVKYGRIAIFFRKSILT